MMQIRGAAAAEDSRRESASDRDEYLTTWFFSHYRSLWSTAFAMLGDPHLAEEAVMETFVRAFSSWRGVRHLDYPPAYLKKILLNICRSKLRRRVIEFRVNALAHHRAESDGDKAGAGDPAGSAVRMDVLSALKKLSPMQRACIILRYFDDMTDQEIAHTLDCSPGTVKSHLFRARKTLEKTLEQPTEVTTE